MTSENHFPLPSKVGLSGHEVPFPDVTICPRGLGSANVSEARKSSVEEALPPMAEMWDEWRKTVSLSFNPNDAPANYSWSSDPSPAVHALMKQAGFSTTDQIRSLTTG